MNIIDMHCDTIMKLYKSDKNIRNNDLMIDLEKLKKSNYLLQCFAMFVPFNRPNPLKTCLEMIDRYYQEIEANNDLIAKALTYNDIINNQNEGKISALLTIEEGGVVENSLAVLRDLYRLGVRMITLTWNYENGIGHPNFSYYTDGSKDFKTPNTKNGLTEFGIKMVKEMNNLGIIIDVSHLSDAGFYDVCKYSTKPFVASHSNARSICPHVRNLTDDMIKLVAKKGGVIGINYCKDFVVDSSESQATVTELIKHIKHIVKIGGISCVGLGSDFDGIPDTTQVNSPLKLTLLREGLLEEGFIEEDIEKIFYKNTLRLFKEVLK